MSTYLDVLHFKPIIIIGCRPRNGRDVNMRLNYKDIPLEITDNYIHCHILVISVDMTCLNMTCLVFMTLFLD